MGLDASAGFKTKSTIKSPTPQLTNSAPAWSPTPQVINDASAEPPHFNPIISTPAYQPLGLLMSD